MKGKDLLEGMSHVDEKYVDEAENARPAKAKTYWVRWASLAACLGVMVFGMFTFDRFCSPAPSAGAETANNANDGQEEMAGLPGQEAIGEGTPGDANEGDSFGYGAVIDKQDPVNWDMEWGPAEEAPSIVVRIDSWQGNGFRGTVAQIVDTDLFGIGTDLTVVFDENTHMAFVEEDQTTYDNRTPTDTDFPAGSLVVVQFTSCDTETGTILASIISQTFGY